MYVVQEKNFFEDNGICELKLRYQQNCHFRADQRFREKYLLSRGNSWSGWMGTLWSKTGY